MSKGNEPVKKVKIRPRGYDQDAAKSGKSGVPQRLTLNNRLQEGGREILRRFSFNAFGKSKLGGYESGSISAEPVEVVEEFDELTPRFSKDSSQKEGWESDLSESAPINGGEVVPGGRTLPATPVRGTLWNWAETPLPAGVVIVLLLAGVALSGVLAWNLGIEEGGQRSLAEARKENAPLSDDSLAAMDQALALLRSGKPDEAVRKLQALTLDKKEIASLSYLTAVAALEAGNTDLAEAKVAESIAKREKVSDALAIQSVVENQKSADPGAKGFGDHKMRAELLLRQAMAADGANPSPMIELASLLRAEKRNAEAISLLRGARSRLNPVDSHAVTDVTLELCILQDTPDDKLPAIPDPEKDIAATFSAAYVALRNSDIDRAAELLAGAQKRISPDLFFYLMNDPAFRKYSSDSKISPFFQ